MAMPISHTNPKSVHLIDMATQMDYKKDGIIVILRLAMKPEGCPDLPKSIAPKEYSLDMVEMHGVSHYKHEDPFFPAIKKYTVPIRRVKVFIPTEAFYFGDYYSSDKLAHDLVYQARQIIQKFHPSEDPAPSEWEHLFYRLRQMIMPKKIHEISLHGQSMLNPFDFHSFPSYVESEFSENSRKLPGVQSLVECPVRDCKQERQLRKTSLWSVIQHVNDFHKWDRHQMADWLDKLHDDGVVDIAFKEKDNG